MSAAKWSVVCEPHGNNPGIVDKAKSAVGAEPENLGGMAIYVTNGVAKEEVCRVAWIRRASKNPKVSFEKAFEAEIKKARYAVKILNEQFDGAGELR